MASNNPTFPNPSGNGGRTADNVEGLAAQADGLTSQFTGQVFTPTVVGSFGPYGFFWPSYQGVDNSNETVTYLQPSGVKSGNSWLGGYGQNNPVGRLAAIREDAPSRKRVRPTYITRFFEGLF